jgi:peptidoglycan/LPS O-acetylase OafA/YrhL
MIKTPASVSATFVFLLLNALIWLAFAIIVAAGLHPSIPKENLVRWTMAILAFLVAGVLSILWFFLRKRSKVAYYLTLVLLLFISLLTVFDEFGLSDLIYLIIAIVPLVLLIKDQAWYLQRETRPPQAG